MQMPIWFLIDDNSRQLLKSMMSKDWLPPGDGMPPIVVKLDTIKEQDRLDKVSREISRKPHYSTSKGWRT